MTSRNLPLVLALLGSLAVAGFGCKKETNRGMVLPRPLTIRATSTEPFAEPEPTGPPRPEDGDGYIPQEVLYLRQVIRNFTQVKSFRASMSVPLDNGTTHGEIEFSRGHGLHGMLQLPLIQAPTSEIYLIGDHVYFRSGSTTWLDLLGTDEGSQMTRVFRSAFTLSPNTSSTFISDSARMTTVTDDPEGCKRYTFTQFLPAGYRETMFICVMDNLPRIIGTVTANGTLEVKYRDYNQPIPLTHPITGVTL